MKCSLCGYEFGENAAKAACEGCILTKNCRLVKCPNCGYEMPKTPEWIGKMSRRLSAVGRQLLKKGKE